MKKILLIALLLIVGCEDKKDENTSNSNGDTDNGGTGDVYADIVVGISLDSGDCSSCSVGNPGGSGLMGACYSCVQIVLDYTVENVGTATANEVRVQFKVEYEPYTNFQLSQINWYSDYITFYSLSPGEHTSGSIVAVDYNYYNGTSLTTYLNVRVYLSSLWFSD